MDEKIAFLISVNPEYQRRVSIVQESPQHCEFPNGYSVSGVGPGGMYSYSGATIEDALMLAWRQLGGGE
jgi:hypothetical protein